MESLSRFPARQMLARVGLPRRPASVQLGALLRCLHHCCPRQRLSRRQFANPIGSVASAALFYRDQRWISKVPAFVAVLAPVFCAGYCAQAESSLCPACARALDPRRRSSARMFEGRINGTTVSEGPLVAGSSLAPLLSFWLRTRRSCAGARPRLASSLLTIWPLGSGLPDRDP
jgi:hypothetical protein